MYFTRLPIIFFYVKIVEYILIKQRILFDFKILLALARLQIESHDIDAARQYCATVLNKDSENVPAAVVSFSRI